MSGLKGIRLRRRAREVRRLRTIDAFAELVAEGATPQDAAEELGHSRAYGNALMQRLKARLGPQAR